MSRTTTSPRRIGAPRPSALASLLAAAALVAAVLVAVPPSAPAALADDTAERWAGYRIPGTGLAAGGWIGAYRVGDTPVFVVTPGRRPNRAGFETASTTVDLAGNKGATRRETERAAWILSKYGGHKDAAQAAAVDAAVLHLLAGPAWQLGGARGARRVRASGDPATVRRFVRLMLRQSRASAGPYLASVTAEASDVGGVTSVTVSVTDGGGGPVAGLPVTVTSPDGGPSTPAAGPIEAVTGDDGRAQVRLAAPLVGWRTVTAVVGQVPAHLLRVRRPDHKGQAAVAEGGARRTLVASALAAVRGPQTLALRAVDDDITAGSPAGVAATVSGDGARRAVTATLHGPFATATATSCQYLEVGRVSSTVGADGTYQLPTVTPSASGYYAWGVAVAGTDISHAVTGCGATTTVKAVPSISVAAQELAIAVGNVAHVRVGLSGLPRSPALIVTATLWGPFASESYLRAAACSGNLKLQDEKRMNGDGTEVLDVYVDEVGWYAWQAEVPPDELRQGSRSQCLAAGTLLEVRG